MFSTLGTLMHTRLEISTLSARRDVRGDNLCAQIRQVLGLSVDTIRCRNVFSIFADLDRRESKELVEAIANPVIERGIVGETDTVSFDWIIIVGFLPGVTDNVANTFRVAFRDVLGRPLAAEDRVHSSLEYLISNVEVTRRDVENVAFKLIANPLIHNIVILSRLDWKLDGLPLNNPVVADDAGTSVQTFDLNVPDDALVDLSNEHTWALSREEMLAIKDHFHRHGEAADRRAVGLGPNPTDVEVEMLAQTWSEHCKHKIFNAVIDYTDADGATETIDGCYGDFIKKSTAEIGESVGWLVSVFSDNAGVIAFNDDYHLVYKVETHNSPSALDPYGGAMTGIVGVNRDTLATGIGATLLVNVWGYCLASPFTDNADVPDGIMHPRRIRDGVHLGCIEGGNQSGIPYGLGWEYFDERFMGKPLVFCGTVGLLPTTVNNQPGQDKDIRPGDLIVMVGGRIGKDGIHGATFSSEELHQFSPVQAVQIGDPITQKKMSDFLHEARDRGLYRYIWDNGAGGLSGSIGEMAERSNGCKLDLARAPLKYTGLKPWEVLLSEAQERMSMAVPPDFIDAFTDLAEQREVEISVLGEFNDSGKFHVIYEDRTVAFLDLDFLHNGLPRLHLKAEWTAGTHPEPPPAADDADLGGLLLAMMARLNVCSGERKARQYDHEVKGLSIIKPYVGIGNDVPSDACVFTAVPRGREGVILAAGILPRYSDIDTYHMTGSVIDLAVRRTIAVGGRLGHIAGLDNFCWPDPVESEKTPDGPYKLAQLVRANKALYEYTRAYQVPCISGKDSMKNDSTRGGRKISIPPTLLFSTMARMADVTKAISLDVKRSGDLVYVLGVTRKELGGSEYYAMAGYTGMDVPTVEPVSACMLYDAVADATEAELCHSVHTPAIGGMAAGFSKMAIGGRLGLDVDLSRIPVDGRLSVHEILFSESNSRFIVTIAESRRQVFEEQMADLPHAQVGTVKHDPVLTFYYESALESEVAVADLREAYTGVLD